MNTITTTTLGHATATPVESIPALDRWASFTEALADGGIWEHLDTQDVVAALIDRSLVEEDLQASAAFPEAELVRLVRADQRYRAAASQVLDHTDIALFKDDEPPTHWWWHVEQLVLGHASEQLLAVPAAAQLKAVHPHTIRAAIKEGRLPARRLARGFLIHRRDLERWQPRTVGRPSGSRSIRANDTLLEAFNAANTAGDWQRAAQLAEAMEADPSTPRRRLAIALTAFNAGDDSKAEHWSARALEGDLPQASRQTALLVQGRALLRQEHPRKALRVLESARGLGYSDWLIDTALADAYLESGDSRRAVEVARRARDEAPDIPEVHYQLARMLWHHNEPWEALEHIIRFRASRPDEPDGLLLQASIVGFLGDRTGEKALYRRARGLVSPLVKAGLLEAISVDGQAAGNLGEGKAALRAARALVREPDPSGHWRHQAWHIVKATVDATDEGAERERVIASARRILGDDGYLMHELAMIMALRGDVDGTLDALGTREEELAGADSSTRLIGAYALLAAGRKTAAYPHLKALAQDMDEAKLSLMVETALEVGDIEGARTRLKAIADANGPSSEVASVAVRLLEHVARTGATLHFGSLDLGIPSGTRLRDAMDPAESPHARDSTWEGLHRMSSAVMEGVTRSYLN